MRASGWLGVWLTKWFDRHVNYSAAPQLAHFVLRTGPTIVQYPLYPERACPCGSAIDTYCSSPLSYYSTLAHWRSGTVKCECIRLTPFMEALACRMRSHRRITPLLGVTGMRDDKNRKLEENAHDIRLTDLIDSVIATESRNVYARDPRILILSPLGV